MSSLQRGTTLKKKNQQRLSSTEIIVGEVIRKHVNQKGSIEGNIHHPLNARNIGTDCAYQSIREEASRSCD